MMVIENLDCPNCGNTDTDGSKFCSNCSQKTNLKLNNVWYMFLSFAANIVDYDSKLFSSIRGLFYPGFLTNEYLAFKRVQYLTPIRLFAFLMFTCFFILSWHGYDDSILVINTNNSKTSNSVEAGSQFNESNYKFLEKSSPKMKTLSLIGSLIEELEKQKLSLKKKSVQQTGDNQSEDLVMEQQLTLLESSIDTLRSLKKSSDFDKSDTFSFTMFFKRYVVEVADINTMSAQQLIEKYQVEHWFEKLAVENFIKFNQDANGFGKFIFQNLIWVVLLDILLMSLVFKLFYVRTKRLYAEHFIFHLHIRAFVFFIGIVLLLIPYTPSGWIFAILSVVLLLYVLKALFKVYQQSKTLTIIKFLIFGIIEFLVFIITFIFVLLVSSLLFKFTS